MLRLLPEMSRVKFYTLCDHFQSPSLAFGATAQEIASLRGIDEDQARAILEAPRTQDIGPELELMDKHGVSLVTIDDADYPENLKMSSFPPPLLYTRGKLHDGDKYSIAMVGSRHSTQYGRSVAEQFAAKLSAVGLTVVSGFARGIDSAAHESVIRAGGRTIGVLGNGLAVTYPAENRRLGDAICANHGALVTEYPMTTLPHAYNFPERNHVIATLSLGTIVVEAAEKSGALITAREAVEENRFVFAVPGDVTRANSRGANKLIQQGARLVQRPEDVLAEMKDQLRGYLRADAFEEAPAGNGGTAGATPSQTASGSNLTGEEAHLVELISHEPLFYDNLLARIDPSRVPPGRLATVLLSLELKRIIKQLPGKVYTISA